MSRERILRLNKAGTPVDWITPHEAAVLHCRGQILWSMGERAFVLRGGKNRLTGDQSRLELPSIIASSGQIKERRFVPALSNYLLFRRDEHLCLYCGNRFAYHELSRDHVMPTSRGGENTWMNVVAACRPCNSRKADKTPEEAGMPLLAVPFRPNAHEFFYLANRHVLADQMEFLRSGFSSHWGRA